MQAHEPTRLPAGMCVCIMRLALTDCTGSLQLCTKAGDAVSSQLGLIYCDVNCCWADEGCCQHHSAVASSCISSRHTSEPRGKASRRRKSSKCNPCCWSCRCSLHEQDVQVGMVGALNRGNTKEWIFPHASMCGWGCHC